MRSAQEHDGELALARKLLEMPWIFIAVISLIAALGISTLSSIRHDGVSLLADRQLIRFLAGLAILMITALVHPSTWLRASYPLYLLALGLVILVPYAGVSPEGA